MHTLINIPIMMNILVIVIYLQTQVLFHHLVGWSAINHYTKRSLLTCHQALHKGPLVQLV